jgi:L-2-hydroxyglutarate oxidase LhgO
MFGHFGAAMRSSTVVSFGTRAGIAVNTVDCAVIGGGVIGLAVARALSGAGREVIILERERHAGMHMSSRNSEVIHAGMHYPQGSLKALTCVSGRELLYRYCDERGIAYRRCGKFIVAASDAELAQLQAIESQARANGLFDLQFLTGAEARRLEPELSCHAALASPSTGIIDSHGYMMSLLADAESGGAQIAYGAAVSALRPTRGGVDISLESESLPVLRARLVVNSAGLDAHHVARLIEGFPAELIPEVRYAKGNYFALTGAAPFGRLIYPVPELGGLGIHMTLDLAGRARFGPDVEWVDDVNYRVDSARQADFYGAIRRYWPRLAAGQLSPAYAGIRPKLLGRGGAADFCMLGPADHGVVGVVNLFGMESPGLTASLAIAAHVAAHWGNG